MPRPRAPAVTVTTSNGTTAAGNADDDIADAIEQSRPCWKDRLTEQQLTRKRAADRRLVRESRSRARKTIAVLQERIDALNGQQEWTITVATAVMRTASTDVAMHTKLAVQPQPVPAKPSICPQPVDPTIALDQRMALADSPSPFPGIHANMDQINCIVNFADDEFLESIMVWKASQSKADDAQLFHIDQGPSNLTRTSLAVLALTSNVLRLMIDDLNSPQSNWNLVAVCDSSLPPASSQKGVSHLKKELAMCAFEAVRPWCYSSTATKVTMFWALYRILTMWQPHPSFVDFILWPRIRAHLANDWETYQRRNLVSAFVENFDLDNAAELRSKALLRVGLTESELDLDPQAERWFQDLSCLRMRRGFVKQFPEFSHFVHVMDTERGFAPAKLFAEFSAEPKQSCNHLGGGTTGLAANGAMNHSLDDNQSKYDSFSTVHTLPDNAASSRTPSMALHGSGSGTIMGCTVATTGFAPSDANPYDAHPHDAQPHDAHPHDAQTHDTQPHDAQPHDAQSYDA
ncbi:hypothetical protein LTR13_011383 [Exophiala sideris]|nr:hypothetical protein LTR13_011383 [Exophiala sideris]